MSQDKPNYEKVDGADLLIAIVAASYNQVLVDALIKQTSKGLKAGGVKEANLRLVKVPGSGEIPYVTNTRQQAEERCTGALDRGTEFAQAALIMAQHRLQLGERLDQVEAEERAKNGGHEPIAQH